jgi:hypothetical protein
MSDLKVSLEYIGPPGEVCFDEVDGSQVSLVAGRRYQMSEALASYRVEHDTRHWQRPIPPKRANAAVKE